jgi:hypothetical protein
MRKLHPVLHTTIAATTLSTVVLALLSASFAPASAAAAEHSRAQPALSSARECRQGSLRCVERVIDEMERRAQPLARHCDHDAVFAIAYLRTTETFLATAQSIGYDDLPSVVREDAQFADYYLRAFDAFHSGEGSVPPAWQIAFTAAASTTLPAVGDAFLGFSAHIQRDLPFVLYDLYIQGHPVSHEDHTLVNDFLAQVDVAGELAARFDPTYPQQGDLSTIVQWRETAWQDFERLKAASDVERPLVAAEIELAAAQSAELLYQTFAYPSGTDSGSRDAYCRAQR